MPCDTIRTVQVDLSKLGRIDVTLLAEALRELGLSVYSVDPKENTIDGYGVSYRGGKLELPTRSRVTEENVCAAYSVQIITSQAKRFGWAFTETTKANEVRK